MAAVAYSARSLGHLEGTFRFFRDEDPQVALDAVAAIRTAVDALGAHPLLGRRVKGDIRELVGSYGRTGYVALYRFAIPRDEVRVLAIRHQRELGFVP